jgi:hypothetical protein
VGIRHLWNTHTTAPGILTPAGLCADNSFVTSRKAICLLVLIFIPIAALGLVPFGHGPSSVVDGPRTAFRAYRASLELKCAVGSTVVISLMAFALASFQLSRSAFDSDAPLTGVRASSLLPTLRC